MCEDRLYLSADTTEEKKFLGTQAILVDAKQLSPLATSAVTAVLSEAVSFYGMKYCENTVKILFVK